MLKALIQSLRETLALTSLQRRIQDYEIDRARQRHEKRHPASKVSKNNGQNLSQKH